MKTIFITLLALISFSSMAQDESVNGDLTIGKPNDAGTLKIKRGTAGGEVAGTIGFLGGGSEVHNLSLQSTSGGGYITFRTNNGGVDERMRIANNGNVGIGTISPNAPIDVRTSNMSGVIGTFLSDQGISNSSEIHRWTIRTGRSYDYPNRTLDFGMVSNSYGQNPAFYVAPKGSEVFRITESGSVGIGTSSPNAKFHVFGNNAGNGNPLASLMIGLNNGTEIEAIQEGTDPDRQSMTFRVKASQTNADLNQEAMRIKYNGYVGIGTNDPQSKLAVNGQIRATEVKVLADISVPDYVFESDYKLRTLQETKEYIARNKHLPEIPSAAEIGENGIDLGDMNMRLLKKVEELTLHLIEQNERVEKLEKEVSILKNK